ncbi:hypothetical protein AC626_01710 [Pseudoalteromonas rubra]|uniref:Uncharacterized protein n=1 Tax=Pseudoalteromonas rubra TaxID=43658 RepID=A0A0L0EYQ8_9GAMM|nr:hypothetical protein AC626_01710 [Pseudoalteromonas rubra]
MPVKRLTNLFKIQADNELLACQSATNANSLFIRFWQHTFNVSREVKAQPYSSPPSDLTYLA